MRSTWSRSPASHFCGLSASLRNRLGELESVLRDRVSGERFAVCRFFVVATAVTAALIESVATGNFDSETYYFGRRLGDALVNLFAIKMAGVFMISLCTIGLRTVILPRWVAFLGYACALVLLGVIANWRWIALVFPGWMLLVSLQIFLNEIQYRRVKDAH